MSASLYGSTTYQADLELSAGSVFSGDLLEGKKVLVTGATGLIGSFAVDVLGLLGSSVIAAGRRADMLASRFSDSPYSPKLAEIDLRRGALPEDSVDYIIHAASNADPASMVADPVGTIETNVIGTLNLLEWAQLHGCRRVLYVSSGEVYGRLDKAEAFSEGDQGYVDPRQMRSCYPLAKRLTENLCVSWTRQHGMETLSGRLCHTFGPTAKKTDSRASSVFALAAASGEPIVMTGPGTQLRSYMHVADAASGLLTALAVGEPGNSYNVSNPNVVVTVREMAEAFAEAGGVPFEAAPLPDGLDVTPITRQVLDSSQLLALGWKTGYSMADGARRTVEVLREVLSC